MFNEALLLMKKMGEPTLTVVNEITGIIAVYKLENAPGSYARYVYSGKTQTFPTKNVRDIAISTGGEIGVTYEATNMHELGDSDPFYMKLEITDPSKNAYVRAYYEGPIID